MKATARGVLQPWPDARPDMAADFLEIWFQERLTSTSARTSDDADTASGPAPRGFLALTPIQAKSGFPARSQFATAQNMIRALRSTTLMPDLISGVGAAGHAGREANLYHAAAMLARMPADLAKHPYARGRKSDIGWVPGLWLDLDVSGEKFGSAGEVLEVVRAMWNAGIRCSALVSTGSGGLHPYFRVKGGLDPGTAEALSDRLRAWVVAEFSGGAAVDRVSNCDRILRTPGSVRFPKAGEPAGTLAVLAGLDWADERRVLDMDLFKRVTERAWEAERASRIRMEGERAERASSENAAFRDAARRGGFWGELQAVAAVEGLFIWLSWEEILLPHGWELVDGDGAPDGEGRRTWTRPGLATAGHGVNRRSMLTDWHENPDVATLKSDSPETGLLGLRRRRIPLTKFRVWLELSPWRGRVEAFVRSGGGGMIEFLRERSDAMVRSVR